MLKRPRPRFLMMSFSIVAMLMLILSACGASGSSTTTTPSAGTPVKGGTWVDDFSQEPTSLLPNASSQTFAAMVDYGLYAPLVYGNYQGQLQPGIATAVPTLANGGISADLKTFTFHLRPNLVWSDGQPLNADDVDFTWKLWNDPKFGAIYTVATSDITSADVSTDKLTIIFHLKDPLVSFVEWWADGYYAPMPKHHFEGMAPDAIKKSADNLNPSVVSGPFMMLENKTGDHITIQRNPKYYRASEGFPYLDKMVFRIVTDQNTILKDFQAGTITSSWFLDVSKTIAYEHLQNYKVVSDPSTFNFEALYFNFKNKVLANNPEVRKAMAMAVDQQAIIDVARRGLGGKLCTEHTATQNPGYTAGITCPQLNPDIAGANTLLDQNGWVAGADGVRAKNGQRLEFQYSTTSGRLDRQDAQLINQANFKKIGIKVDIQNYPSSTLFGTFLLDQKPGVWDIVEFTTANGYDPDSSALFTCGLPTNPYCNPKMDAQYKAEQSSADPAVRQKAFDAIHQIELTDFPFIVLYSAPDVAVVRNGTHNFTPSLVGLGETINLWNWWCDGGKC